MTMPAEAMRSIKEKIAREKAKTANMGTTVIEDTAMTVEWEHLSVVKDGPWLYRTERLQLDDGNQYRVRRAAPGDLEETTVAVIFIPKQWVETISGNKLEVKS